MLKPVQALDMDNEPGRRNIYLSRQPQLLSGFSLNRTYTFDSIVRNTLPFALSRDTLSGYVEIPALLPGINFQASDKHPLYSFIAALGVIPDVEYNGVKYDAPTEYQSSGAIGTESAWYPVLNGSPAFRLDLNLPIVPPGPAFSLMLSIGVRFGTIAEGGTVQQVKHAGSAKVLAMG
ncbi:hypothetical protein [Flavisolibacter tropicus]|nr:hypothetical protein [Flavisolibacter tropicus]